METKICNKCNRELSIICFSKANGANYYRPECKECNNNLSRKRKQLRKKYGNPPVGYICPLCHRTEEEVKGLGGKKCSTWVLDHDHKTDTFRGWLCHSCNRGLGFFQDSIIILDRAKTYLEPTTYGITN
tara:strand:- start:190 stop:576 length:387 start_codon:yes stop_codon:yes gene_type:complete